MERISSDPSFLATIVRYHELLFYYASLLLKDPRAVVASVTVVETSGVGAVSAIADMHHFNTSEPFT